MPKFLDFSGLSHYTQKIKALIPSAFLKGASVSLDGNTLTLTKQDDTTVVFSGGGGSGATFTPSVSSAGVISWTNDKGLPNPTPVNIKGPAPVKGTDYWTQSDQATIVQEVLAQLPTYDGTVE